MSNSNQKGITLVELILYVSISSVVLITLVAFYHANLKGSIKANSVHKVQTSGQQLTSVLRRMSNTMATITSPSLGANSNTIIFNTNSTSTDPTQITLVSEYIEITEDTDGTPRTYRITPTTVSVTNLDFSNLSSGTVSSFQYQATINSNVGNQNNQEYIYEATYQSSVTGK